MVNNKSRAGDRRGVVDRTFAGGMEVFAKVFKHVVIMLLIGAAGSAFYYYRSLPPPKPFYVGKHII